MTTAEEQEPGGSMALSPPDPADPDMDNQYLAPWEDLQGRGVAADPDRPTDRQMAARARDHLYT
jgi:hypothetical protein